MNGAVVGLRGVPTIGQATRPSLGCTKVAECRHVPKDSQMPQGWMSQYGKEALAGARVGAARGGHWAGAGMWLSCTCLGKHMDPPPNVESPMAA